MGEPVSDQANEQRTDTPESGRQLGDWLPRIAGLLVIAVVGALSALSIRGSYHDVMLETRGQMLFTQGSLQRERLITQVHDLGTAARSIALRAQRLAEPNAAQIQTLLLDFAEAHPGLLELHFSGNLNGEPVKVLVRRGLGQATALPVRSDEPLQLPAVGSGEIRLGEIQRRKDGRRELAASIQTGKPGDALEGSFQLSLAVGATLDGMLADLPTDTRLYLANSNGRFLVHHHPDRAFRASDDAASMLDPDLRWDRQGKVIQGERPEALRPAVIDGVDLLVEVVRVPFDPRHRDRDLSIVLAQTRDDVAAAAGLAALPATFAILIASLALMLLLIVWMRRRGTTLQPLVDALQHITNGNFDTPLPEFRHRELGHLVMLVGKMLNQLKTREDKTLQETATLKLLVDQKQQALDRALDLQSAILNNAGSAIITADSNGLVSSFNPAAAHMLGYSGEEVIGTAPIKLFFDHDEIAARGGVPHDTDSLATLAGLSTETLRSQNEWTFIHKEGKRIPVLLSVRQLKDEAGKGVGELTIAVDMSDLKAKEQALREAMTLARDADRAKGEFLANMSHEIRTPMNGIIGLAQLLLDSNLPKTQREFAESLLDSARSLLTILNDILDYSKIEAGRMELEKAPFKLNQLLDSITALFVARAEEKRIELLLDIANDVPQSLRGDSLRLSQIINNLVSNAIKFTDTGQITIRVERAAHGRVKLADLDELALRFCVIDTGRGMTEAEMQRLFTAFQQADASITRRYGGTGLGLTICRRLTELMGGEIGVDSEVGKGSTFWFTVQLHISADDPLDMIPADIVPLDALQPMRTLLVDDHPSSSRMLLSMLDAHAFEVEHTDDADEALRLLGADREATGDDADRPAFDLLLLNWNISGSAAQQVAQRLGKRIEAQPDGQPTIGIMASRGFRNQAANALPDEAMVELIDKPVTTQRLSQALNNIQSPDHLTTAAEAPRKEIRVDEITRPIHGARILLVEDNPTNQLIATSLLERMHLKVEVAENGREGVDMANANDYAAILMDLAMPVMDGLEATRELRRSHPAADLPIIAMTAAAFDTDREATRDAGMNAHITKPIDVVELAHTLVDFIDRREDSVEELLDLDMDAASAAPIRSGASTPGTEFSLPGFDFTGVMEGLGDDWGLLRELLRSFHNDFVDAGDRLNTLLGNGEINQAQRLAHTIKGLARTLGAAELAQHATTLDAALKKGDIPEHAEFDGALAETLAAIEGLLNN